MHLKNILNPVRAERSLSNICTEVDEQIGREMRLLAFGKTAIFLANGYACCVIETAPQKNRQYRGVKLH